MLHFIIFSCVCLLLCSVSRADELEEAQKFLEKVNKEAADANYNYQVANWEYETNMTDENTKKKLAASEAVSKMAKPFWEETKKFKWQEFKDETMKRQFQSLSLIFQAALPDDKYSEFDEIVSQMTDNYVNAQICSYKDKKKCDLYLDPDILKIMAESRDEAELNYTWTEFMKAAGPPSRPLYPKYVELWNEAATIQGFKNAAELWMAEYYTPDFEKIVNELWEKLRPLYLELYTYVRRKLREKYGDQIISKNGLIPVHLLGDAWGYKWSNIVDIIAPFPDVTTPDITKALVDQKFTPLKMVQTAEDFYTSIGLKPVPDSFWKNSIFERIPDTKMICHPSAWDFHNRVDFRIKMCIVINQENFFTIHHELGHTKYQMAYADLPFLLRDGANPAVHESVGDLITLSVRTQKHLSKLGLLPKPAGSKEEDLTQLFNMALDKIGFLPFGLAVDLWRWQVFRGEITPENYTCKWWEILVNLQGVKPPVVRTENDFDPVVKFHVSADVRYISYFLGVVLQFQFYESMCIAAKEYDPNDPAKPLHQCDFHQNKEAGALLENLLKLGWSKPWEDAVEAMTGKRFMDPESVIRYFQPLLDWLKQNNKESGETVGWETTEKVCTPK